MSSSYKPGGGNKPQLYIPKGHGEKSGEYTNRKANQRNSILNCYTKNVKFQYNFCHCIHHKPCFSFYSFFPTLTRILWRAYPHDSQNQ